MAVVGEMHYLTIGNNTYSIPVSGGGGGTVTSVRVQATSPVQSSTSGEQTISLNTTISLADGYGDTKNPYGTKTANYILAGPTSGSAAAPTFRALTAADIPDLSSSYLPSSTAIPSKTSDLTNDSGFITGMTILSYGSSTWADFLAAYNANKVVYCRASSNSNPASGSQTRLAFMAYVNNATSPTEVEFQYYRSVNSHSDSQQGDQVFVYKITSAGTWTVTTRNAFTKIAAGGDLSSSYSSGTLTISADIPTVPTNVSAFTNDAGYLTSYTDEKVAVAAVNSGTVYYPIMGINTTAATRQYDTNGFKYVGQTGSAVSQGYATLTLGNDIASGTVNNKQGQLAIYGSTAYQHLIKGAPTSNRTLTLPDKAGTIALTSDMPTKTSDLTNDSGFITNNHLVVTQAQYNALTPTQKAANIVYFISDGAPDAGVPDAYPVGAYFETSDMSFNPNLDWGGTWEAATIEMPPNLVLGGYVTEGILTSSCGSLYFVIPTGRIYPTGTTIESISFEISVRGTNSNGTGLYIVKNTSGYYDTASFNSTTNSTFYNGDNILKTLTPNMWRTFLFGNSNIRINLVSETEHFFSGSATTTNYLNNNAASIDLSSIEVSFNIPSNADGLYKRWHRLA